MPVKPPTNSAMRAASTRNTRCFSAKMRSTLARFLGLHVDTGQSTQRDTPRHTKPQRIAMLSTTALHAPGAQDPKHAEENADTSPDVERKEEILCKRAQCGTEFPQQPCYGQLLNGNVLSLARDHMGSLVVVYLHRGHESCVVTAHDTQYIHPRDSQTHNFHCFSCFVYIVCIVLLFDSPATLRKAALCSRHT